MLHVIRSFGEELPAACQNSCQEAWTIFDTFLSKYGSDYDMAERATRVIRHGINLFGSSALSVAPSVISRMSLAFEATGFPSYLWIAGKIINRFGNEENQNLRASYHDLYERATNKMVAFLQVKTPGDLPDGKRTRRYFLSTYIEHPLVLEDYLQLELQLVDFAPDIYFQSSAFPLAFRASTAALTVIHSDIIFTALELFRLIVTHDCLGPVLPSPVPPKFPLYAAAIRGVVDKEGFEFVGYVLTGLVGDFPEDSTSLVVSILRAISFTWSNQFISWLPAILQQLPTTAAPNQAKTQFLTEVTGYVHVLDYHVHH